MRIWWPAVAVTMVPGLSGLAVGQSAVRGTVRADSSLRAVAAAEIVVEGPEVRLGRAGLTGGFVVGGIPAGRFALAVRAIGYRPLRLTIELTGRDTLELDLRLQLIPQELAPLTVVGRPARMTATTPGFSIRSIIWYLLIVSP